MGPQQEIQAHTAQAVELVAAVELRGRCLEATFVEPQGPPRGGQVLIGPLEIVLDVVFIFSQQGALAAHYTEAFLPTLNAYATEAIALASVLPATKAAQYLQYFYIADNPHPIGEKDGLGSARDGSAYSDVHRRLHFELQALTNRFGFYDLLLVQLL